LYWFMILGAASGVAYKMPEQLASGIDLAYGWDPDRLRPAMKPPEAAESPSAFARIAAEPAQSVIGRVAFRMPVLLATNSAILIAAGILLGRVPRPQESVPL